MLVIVGTSKDAHSLKSQVGIGSESDCLFGQFDRILWISVLEAGGKDEKSTGIAVGDSECGDDVTGLLVRERCNLDILSVKKDAKLSACEMPEKEEGNGEEDMRCSSLFTVCQRRLGLAEAEEMRLE